MADPNQELINALMGMGPQPDHAPHQNALAGYPPAEYLVPESAWSTMPKAAGAGAVSPFGATEWLLRKLAPNNETARWAADGLEGARDKHPTIAGLASGAALGAVANPTIGMYAMARNQAMYPAYANLVSLGGYLKGMGWPGIMGATTVGGSVGRFQEEMKRLRPKEGEQSLPVLSGAPY